MIWQAAAVLVMLIACVNVTLAFSSLLAILAAAVFSTIPARRAEAAQRLTFVRDVRTRLELLPGVTDVTAANVLPARAGNNGQGVEIEGQPLARDAEPPSVDARWVEPNYFATLRLPILEGRGIEEADREGSRPVVVVSRSFAQRFWPGQDAIGRRFRTVDPASDTPWLTVVGISGSGSSPTPTRPRCSAPSARLRTWRRSPRPSAASRGIPWCATGKGASSSGRVT